jgi:ABC-type cobalamin/Fe3+-siderophores transport system ATPase subunit
VRGASSSRGQTPAPVRHSLGWIASGLRFAYPGAARPVLDDVSITVPAAACTALLGPNGSGKSTLLRLLLGTRSPGAGEISFGGRPLPEWERRELALAVGVVAQSEEIAFPLSVREMVAMGRYPHLGPFRAEREIDREACRRALEKCDVVHLQDRRVDTLSGGERQRARIARALAQEPQVLALDEPTLALDIRHEMEIFELIRDLSGSGVTVLLVTHNLNLAARYADRLVLLDEGRVAAAGAPADVLRRELLEQVYRWPLRVAHVPGSRPDTGDIQVTPLGRREIDSLPADLRTDPDPEPEPR